MNCAEFESRLTALAAGEGGGDPRVSGVERLRQHTAECPACGGTAGLLELLALPAAERAPVPDPGAHYWDTFDARVAARIAEADAAPPAAFRGSGYRRVAAVAVLTVLAGTLWFWLRVAPEAPELTWLIAENMTDEAVGAPVDLPGDLAALLDGLSADRAADALAGLVESSGSMGTAGFLVEGDGLDGTAPVADLDALMDGVDRWDPMAGLVDWLPEDGAESMAVEAGLPGTLNHGVTPFPDARGLGAEARKEFVRWISEQLRPEADLS